GGAPGPRGRGRAAERRGAFGAERVRLPPRLRPDLARADPRGPGDAPRQRADLGPGADGGEHPGAAAGGDGGRTPRGRPHAGRPGGRADRRPAVLRGARRPDHDRRRAAAGQPGPAHRSQTRSMILTFAWPPPSHIVTIPYRPPVRASEWASVVSSRAPVAPSGWPSAIAPPQTLTRVRSAPVSRCQASTTGANASLISMRSSWPRVIPARRSAWAVAAIGAVSIMTGSSPRADR